jgi:hypothetical protein
MHPLSEFQPSSTCSLKDMTQNTHKNTHLLFKPVPLYVYNAEIQLSAWCRAASTTPSTLYWQHVSNPITSQLDAQLLSQLTEQTTYH